MNQTNSHRSICFQLLSVVFAALLFLSGCAENPPASQPSQSEYESFTASTEPEDSNDQSDVRIREAFANFCDQLFKKEVTSSTLTLHSLLADPAAAGITDCPVSYGSISLEDLKADMADTKEMLKELDGFPEEQLTEDQKLTRQVLKAYLETALSGDGLELYEQPLAPTIGTQAQLPIILAEYIFYTKEDIDTYLNLLSQIDEYYGEIGEFEKAKADAGLFMSDASVDSIITSCESYLVNPEDNFITQTFDERIEQTDGLTEEEKAAYRTQHIEIIKHDFVPAYQNLIETLSSLKGTGKNDQGMCGYPEGKTYYEYLIHGVTGTSFDSVDRLQNAIIKEMSLDTGAIASALKEDSHIASLIGSQTFRLTEPEAIITDLQKQITKDFPPLPPCSYTIKDIPKALELSLSPAFYILPPLDRFEDNRIYINRNERFQDEPLYTVLAHEGYPGHLYQTVYFINKNDSPLRHLISFGSYTEGWATYVEFQSYFFDNGIEPDLQQLLMHNQAVTLGLHAYLDLKVNYYGWTKDDLREFLEDSYSITDDSTINEVYQTMIDNPANYLQYYVGYIEIASMRREAEIALDDRFSPMEFHKFLLDIGPAPFTVIRPHFDQWLEEKKAS